MPSTIAAYGSMHTVFLLVKRLSRLLIPECIVKQLSWRQSKAMCSTSASLAISEPAVADSLKSMGLDAVTEAAHKVQGTASDMFLRWLSLEEVLLLKMTKRNLMKGPTAIDLFCSLIFALSVMEIQVCKVCAYFSGVTRH